MVDGAFSLIGGSVRAVQVPRGRNNQFTPQSSLFDAVGKSKMCWLHCKSSRVGLVLRTSYTMSLTLSNDKATIFTLLWTPNQPWQFILSPTNFHIYAYDCIH
ncbi:uncharacterized protein AKAW2_10026S [Aspergillus luchuensis]|uniref:Uncharacterized protein n=1 Tax=Aspergillus kawachii TaxID=1069201 RepID=A0A7R7VYE5_ASPKA|nr:uncharacterized protein AKAW2_10026S [Aspergillus luchuensis]BCR92980.1 hypothetical protein AKAW2_10026S [Aspergillus luchuensis]